MPLRQPIDAAALMRSGHVPREGAGQFGATAMLVRPRRPTSWASERVNTSRPGVVVRCRDKRCKPIAATIEEMVTTRPRSIIAGGRPVRRMASATQDQDSPPVAGHVRWGRDYRPGRCRSGCAPPGIFRTARKAFTAGATLITGADGVSRILAEDLAVAVLDELESPGGDKHFTVG